MVAVINEGQVMAWMGAVKGYIGVTVHGFSQDLPPSDIKIIKTKYMLIGTRNRGYRFCKNAKIFNKICF